MSPEDQDPNFSRILDAARLHAANIQTDISNAKDRIEHIRLTALAQEARNLLTDLESYHSRGDAVIEDRSQEVLDLPEFKSPYNPRT